MPALTPGPTLVREGDSALVRVLEASIEILKAENEMLRRRLAAAEGRAAGETREGRRGDRPAFGYLAAQGASGRPWRWRPAE
jgi:hypothetical protein